MKKLLFFSLLFALVGSFALHAQESKYETEIHKQQKLFDQQLGHHFGCEYFGSYTKGIRLFYGNRLSKHWMVGGLVGADILQKEWEADFPFYSHVSIPVIAQSRFYFGISRFMPYLSLDLGAGLSADPTLDCWVGLGADINIFDSHTIFIGAGYGGRTPFDNLDIDMLRVAGLFLRIGYYF